MKIIHQIWFQGYENIPEKYISNINQLKEYNKDFKYILWDDKSLKELAKRYSNDCYTIYMNYKYMHQKIDLGRYLVLYFYGGISVDMDIFCNIGLSTIYDNLDQSYDIVVSKIPSSLFYYIFRMTTLFVNNAIIISFREKSEILLKIINEILQQKCNEEESQIYCINKTTGPDIFNDLIRKYKDSVLFLDHGIIEMSCFDTIENCLEKNNNKKSLYHIYEMSWINPFLAKLWKIYMNYNYFFIFDLLVLFIIFYTIYKLFKFPPKVIH